MPLRYVDYDIVFQEIPDEVTLAVNLSGCPNGCPGCHSPQLMQEIGEPLTERVLTGLLHQYGSAVTCVCLMGGDGDTAEVARFARFLQTQSIATVKVGWYSGRLSLPDGFPLQALQYVKLGPYIEKLGGLRAATTNQRLYKITGTGELQDITGRFRTQ